LKAAWYTWVQLTINLHVMDPLTRICHYQNHTSTQPEK